LGPSAPLGWPALRALDSNGPVRKPRCTRTAAIFPAWQARLAELYVSAGVDPTTASSYAITLIAASEGAVALSRAQRSLAPFEEVAAHLLATTP
jgi:hypothetical protein